jgi:hypothetical protein
LNHPSRHRLLEGNNVSHAILGCPEITCKTATNISEVAMAAIGADGEFRVGTAELRNYGDTFPISTFRKRSQFPAQKMAALGVDSAFRSGAPRTMKMGTSCSL